MKKIITIFGSLILIAITWFLASPLFINETVDESLPTKEALMAMSEAERQRTMQLITKKMASMPDKAMQEEMAMQSPVLIKQGLFKDADAIHQGSGKALIYQLEDGSHLLRLEDFMVTNGPDLMVYLTKKSDITKASQVADGFISLGDLKGNIGNQNYIIPTGTDIAQYNSAVIWCELFGVLFSPATFQ